MKKKIHVNRHAIARNKRTGSTDPVFTVKTYKQNATGNAVTIRNDKGGIIARFVYSPDRPLPCGAVAWVETSHDVQVELGNDDLAVVL